MSRNDALTGKEKGAELFDVGYRTKCRSEEANLMSEVKLYLDNIISNSCHIWKIMPPYPKTHSLY